MKKLKKSRQLSLVLMGTLALTACSGSDENIMSRNSDDKGDIIFKNKSECVASGDFTEEQCAKMEADALASRPKFATREECVAQFGENACQQTQAESNLPGQQAHGNSMWMPMLAGFIAGQYLGNRMTPAQGLYQNPQGTGLQTSQGKTFTPANTVKPATSKASPLGRAVNRGGFSTGSGAVGS